MSNEMGNELGNNGAGRGLLFDACLLKSRHQQVTKMAHYYLSVDALTRPMQVREDSPPYGEQR
jgi:hypothetical protein